MFGHDILTIVTPLDVLAVGVFVATWLWVGWRIEHPSASRPSVSVLMAAHRREWMRQMVARENRIFDSQILGTLRQGTAFFASTSVLAIGGALALIGSADRIADVASGFGAAEPVLVWQVRLGLPLLMMVDAFLAFVWANRLFGYSAVVMAAVPNDPSDPAAEPRAMQSAELNIRAAVNFNRGLRAMYFALAGLAWLVGPLPLLVALAATVRVLWSREFSSASRTVLLKGA